MYALIKKLYGKDLEDGFEATAFDNYKKSQPQFKTLKSTLTFNGDKTLFTPVPQETVPNGWFSLTMTDQNSIGLHRHGHNAAPPCKKAFSTRFFW